MKDKLNRYPLSALILMSVLISFLGWMVENIWIAMTKGYVNNRNMFLPFLLGYGLFILVLYLIMDTPKKFVTSYPVGKKAYKWIHYLVYTLVVMAGVSTCEIILGYFVESSCGFEYWNYSNLPLHITKYTSIPTSLAFAVMITFFMDQCLVPFMNLISHVPHKVRCAVAFPISAVLLLDYLVSFAIMNVSNQPNKIWQITLWTKLP